MSRYINSYMSEYRGGTNVSPFRKLTDDEANAQGLLRGRRAASGEYEEYIRQIQDGGVGTLDLGDDKAPTIRQRLIAAANRLGLQLQVSVNVERRLVAFKVLGPKPDGEQPSRTSRRSQS